jgi:hypothetical protein
MWHLMLQTVTIVDGIMSLCGTALGVVVPTDSLCLMITATC